jgi:Domain of unknown function (DUF6916)
MTDIDALNHELFSQLLGQSFRVHLPEAPDSTLHLTMSEVTVASAPGMEESSRQPFSLLFRGPPEPLLVQQVYTLEHEQLGELEIFLVPLGPQQDALLYEAVFS